MVQDKSRTQVINDFLVGCDPEFVLLDDKGAIFNTLSVWPQEGEIGWDHGGRVQELRPKPTKGTYALVKRLQELILSKKLASTVLACRAGAMVNDESLGGHFHFGVPYYSSDGTFYKTHLETIKALDAVTALLEHLDILPMQQCINRRKGRFGKFGDVRPSGTDNHIEYRTMASWLYDPKTAFLCLTAAKLAAADPKGTSEALAKVTSFQGLEDWIQMYKAKDTNARRTLEVVLARGHKALQIDPDVDFRGRWERLGL